MLIYTSITNSYLPKARVLAKSVKEFMPEVPFVLVLSDQLPEDIISEDEPFDRILSIEELEVPVDNLKSWIFEHAVVELCTAVKGPALVKFLKEGEDKVVYLDPDTCLYNSIQPIFDMLDEHPVVLTPHMTSPNEDFETIWETEVSCLKHGCYNLGFLAVTNNREGMEFAQWWCDRLVILCYDDIPNGIFTDQRWIDLAPCLFEYVYILHDTAYNVASWNITKRKLEMDQNDQPIVDGKPLRFYHFSGFDSGTDDRMSDKYQGQNDDLKKFRREYITKVEENGQKRFKGMKGYFDFFSDGTPIEKSQRLFYKMNKDLQEAFPDPYDAAGYLDWYLKNQPDVTETNELKREILNLNNTIKEIYNSRSYRLARKIMGVAGKFKCNR